MRVADVDAEPRPRDAETARADEDIIGIDAPRAEVGLEPQIAAGHALHPRPRADQQGLGVVERSQAGVGEVAREHADAVAAHLGLRAVCIAVVHKPLRAAGGGIRALFDRR